MLNQLSYQLKTSQQKVNFCLLLTLFFNQWVFAAAPVLEGNAQWEIVDELTDEFNASSLNKQKWDDYHPHWSGRKPSEFKKGNCYVKNGHLLLRSTVKILPSKVKDPYQDVWVNSAACVSKHKSAQPGYYYEARIKASSLSMTSSFWFRVGEYSEIDVIEHIGNPSVESRQADLPYQYHANTHYYGPEKGLKPLANEYKMATRGRDEFHVYGFWWKDANTLWFYHNDKKVMEIKPRVPFKEPLKMIFDTEVFPWASAGVPHIGLPKVQNLNDPQKNVMRVDWVRTYRVVKH